MANILGIVARLGQFLSNENESITVPVGNEETEVLVLKEKRVYCIPDFQREIRWETENIAQLIDDLKSGSRFLGNVILTMSNENKLLIIDGQQRITSLIMILICIQKLHGDCIDVFTPCQLSIESFSEYNTVIESSFSDELMSSQRIIRSDKLNQRNKYKELWDFVIGLESIKNQISAEEILHNLEDSTLNLIIDRSKNKNDSIRYFIDVNLKGKQLDVEDIFKSYIFKNDSGQEIRDEWYQFKQNIIKVEKNGLKYPLTKVLLHFFYCDLYKLSKFDGAEFGDDFLLKKEFVSKEDGRSFRDGTHLVEMVRNKTYMVQSIKTINLVLRAMNEFVEADSVTSGLKEIFLKDSGVELDSVELQIIQNITKKILLDKNVLPKALIMKYLLALFNPDQKRTKQDYQKIYGVYVLAVLFTIFENNKSVNVLLSIMRKNNTDWYEELIQQVQSYFDTSKITDARLLAQYKLGSNEDEDNYKFRCKSLATIYNFFRISNNKVIVKRGKMDDLRNYIYNNDMYSVEHFIIPESRKKEILVEINGEKTTYLLESKTYTKYVNSLFNFIFIPKELNGNLGNYWLPYKLDTIDTDQIKCSYSKMYLKNVIKIANEMRKMDGSNVKLQNELDSFFMREFKEKYVEFAKIMLNEVLNAIKST